VSQKENRAIMNTEEKINLLIEVREAFLPNTKASIWGPPDRSVEPRSPTRNLSAECGGPGRSKYQT
jgi:hypothetical protein